MYIYNVYQIIKSLLLLFVLKTKPKDILYSKPLLVVLIVFNFLVNYKSKVMGITLFNAALNNATSPMVVPTFWQSMVMLSLLFIFLWGLVYATLAYFHKANRFVQVLIGLVGVDIILRILAIICMVLYKIPIFELLAIILLIPLLYWEFIVYIFIFANSFDINYFKSGVFTLGYMLLQSSISEWLFKYIAGY